MEKSAEDAFNESIKLRKQMGYLNGETTDIYIGENHKIENCSVWLADQNNEEDLLWVLTNGEPKMQLLVREKGTKNWEKS